MDIPSREREREREFLRARELVIEKEMRPVALRAGESEVDCVRALHPAHSQQSQGLVRAPGARQGAGCARQELPVPRRQRPVLAIYWYSPPEQSNTLRPKQSDGGNITHDF